MAKKPGHKQHKQYCNTFNKDLIKKKKKKSINPEYSLEGLLLKLKLQYFGHLIRRANSLEKTLMLRKTEGEREGDDRG